MTGTVTLSIEIELGWGTHDLADYAHLSPDGNAEREALSFLLDLASEYEVPISFSVVGHLLHSSCHGRHEGPYPDSWWAEDPGTDEETDSLFYTPSMIESVAASDIAHEICTHTYSHVLCERMSDEVLDNELSVVKKMYEQAGLPEPMSIVTPRHQEPSYDTLRANGIRVIRTPFPESQPQFDVVPAPVEAFYRSLFRQHPLTQIDTRKGVVETKTTHRPSFTTATLPRGQAKPHPAFRVIPRRIRQRLHSRYLQDAVDRAADSGAHVHLWTHLYNVAGKPQQRPIRRGFERIAERRNRGDIEVLRMRDLVEC